MYIDALLRVANAQAFTAAAVSASSIDLGPSVPKRAIGSGEAMGFGVAVNVGASATSVLVEIISATDDALTTSVVVHASSGAVPAAQLPTGGLLFVGLPKGTPTQRYLGVRVTPVGGAATVTLTAWLTVADLFSILPQHYASGFTI